MLSMGYTPLCNDLMGALSSAGLDPYVGFLHRFRYGRPSLALDLMEEFRSIIMDSVVMTMINNDMVTPECFESELNGMRMSRDFLREFRRKYEERKETAITHPHFGYRPDYRTAFQLQARILAKVLTGELPRYVPFAVK